MTTKPFNAIAERWAGEPCTLNGRPAKITGSAHDAGSVGTLDPTGPKAQWSWPAIDRIMQSDREFRL